MLKNTPFRRWADAPTIRLRHTTGIPTAGWRRRPQGNSTIPVRIGPLTVEPMPMPPNGDGFWRTYTSMTFVNGALRCVMHYLPDPRSLM